MRTSRGNARSHLPADLITLGPGSLYTSMIPNLLVKGVSEAIDNSRAQGVFRKPDVATWRNDQLYGFTAC